MHRRPDALHAGDNGLDELLAQFDRDRRPWYVLQDAGGDVIALAERTTTPAPSSSGNLPTTRVTYTAAQWTYGAYGEVLTADSLRTHPQVHLGHKGLFFDRLDGGIVDTTTGEETPRLVPGANLLGYARNRTYSPRLGRWVQKDPNATACTLLQSQTFHGVTLAGSVSDANIETLYADGLSLYEYVGSGPWGGTDPMGLDFSLVGLMFSATNEADLQVDWAQQVMDAGDDVSTNGTEILNRAALDQFDDFMWASDWSRSDDDYSRTKNSYVSEGAVSVAEGDGFEVAGLGHHILTRCNLKAFKGGYRWTREFIKLFRKHGLKGRAKEILNSTANTMELVTAAEQRAHKGSGHSYKYHMCVLDRCSRAMSGKTGEEALLALMAELNVIRDLIRKSPEVLRGVGLP